MKKKADKEKDVDKLRAELKRTANLIVSGFERLTVQQDFELRKAVRQAGGRYQVVKNALAGKAAEGTAAEGALKDLTGMNAIALTQGDPVALAKALTEYAKSNATFTFKAGVVEGRAIDVGGIKALATMPSREELFAKILYLIQAPAQRLVTAIGGVGRNLAVVIDQGCKEGKFSA
jgi:large subunit ribosomal protein L10